MAFEVPLEADRPDGLGFLSSFVRAPVVGTIMWVFGGKAAKEIDEKTRLESVAEEAEAAGTEITDNSESEDELEHFYEASSEPARDDSNSTSFQAWGSDSDNIRKKGQVFFNGIHCESKPSIVQTDTSEDGDTEERLHCDSPFEVDEVSFLGESSWSPKQSNSISWSDQSGQSLCQYMDEFNIVKHTSSADVKGPTKSAMKRSSSHMLYSKPLHQLANEPSKDDRRKTPSDQVQFGMPGSSSAPSGAGPNGYVSPQYGWYVTGSTTPPTPEMYVHPRKSSKSAVAPNDSLARSMKRMSVKDPSPLQSAAFITMKGTKKLPKTGHQQESPPHHRRMPTPKFTKNPNAYANSIGWPGVPL